MILFSSGESCKPSITFVDKDKRPIAQRQDADFEKIDQDDGAAPASIDYIIREIGAWQAVFRRDWTDLTRRGETELAASCCRIIAERDFPKVLIRKEASSLGAVAAYGGIPPRFAIELLIWATNHNAHPDRLWPAEQRERIIRRAL